MNEQSDLQLIKHLCILNFLELQNIKQKLDIADTTDQDFERYQNSVHDWIKDLDSKRFNLMDEIHYNAEE
jgi:hypothetical protein